MNISKINEYIANLKSAWANKSAPEAIVYPHARTSAVYRAKLEIQIEVMRLFLSTPDQVLQGSRMVNLDLSKPEHYEMYFSSVYEKVNNLKVSCQHKQLLEETYQKGKELMISNNIIEAAQEQRQKKLKKIIELVEKIGLTKKVLSRNLGDRSSCLAVSNLALKMSSSLLELCIKNKPSKEQLIEDIIPRINCLRKLAFLVIDAEDIGEIKLRDEEITFGWVSYLQEQGCSEEDCRSVNYFH